MKRLSRITALTLFATLVALTLAGCGGGGGGSLGASTAERGGVITGVITDPATGAPLAGATVRLSAALPDPAAKAASPSRAAAGSGSTAETVTDVNGRYEFRDVPAGEYDLTAGDGGQLGAHLRTVVRAGATADGSVALTPVVALTGRVTLPVIQGVRPAEVEAFVWLLGTGYGATGLLNDGASTPTLLAFDFEIRGVPVRADGLPPYTVKFYSLGMTPATMALPLDQAAFMALGGFTKTLPTVALDASPDGGPSLNLPPLVSSAVSDRTAYPLPAPDGTVAVTLAATASDPDGDPLTYRWIQTGGPTPDALVGAGNPGRAVLSKAGHYTFLLTVRDDRGGLSQPVTVTFEVLAAPSLASSFRVEAPAVATAGAPFAVRLAAVDAAGAVVPSYAGVKTITFAGPAAAPGGQKAVYPATVTFTAGVADNVPATLHAAERTWLDAEDGALAGRSGPIAVAPAAANRCLVTAPATATTGQPFPVQAEAVDAYGNRAATNAAATLSAVLSDGTTPAAGTLGGTTTGSFSAGLLPLVTVSHPAVETIRVKVDAGTGLSGLSAPIPVASGQAVTLRVTGPATATAGQPAVVTLRALDAAGNVAAGYVGNHAIVLSGPSVLPTGLSPSVADATGASIPLGAPATLDFTAGVASAPVTFVKAESCTLDAADGMVSSAADPAHDLDVTVAAGPCTSYRVTVPATVPFKGPFAMAVAAFDAFGNPAAGAAAVTLGATVAGTLGVIACDCSSGAATVAAQTFDALGTVAFTAIANGTSGQSATVTVAAASANAINAPAGGDRRNDNRVDYTLGAAAASATLTWTRTAGTADPASPHVAALAGAELAVGRHPLATLANNPALVAGATYTLRLDSTAAADGAAALPVTVAGVTYDTADPAIVSVDTTAADGTYLMGATLDFTVTYNEPVIVDTSLGTPYLLLDPGMADYVSCSGATLVFRCTVINKQESFDYAPSTDPLYLNGAVIRDLAGNPASAVLPDPALFRAAHAIIIDADPPFVSGVTATSGNGRAGSVVTISVVLKESMTLSGGLPTLALQLDNRVATVNASGLATTNSPNDTLVFPFTVLPGDTATDLCYVGTGSLALNGATLADAAGNLGSPYTLPPPGMFGALDSTSHVTVDAVAPSFSIAYYSDFALTLPLGANPRLKAGAYYLAITSSEPLTVAPSVTIDAEGSANDVTNALAVQVSGNVYRLIRTIAYDALAVGAVRESVRLSGTGDAIGNAVTAVAPTDEATMAAFPDTVDPTFTVDYFADAPFATPLGANPRLKPGTYYIRVTASEPLVGVPTLTINAEGATNDVFDGSLGIVDATTWRFSRTIMADPAGAGVVKENFSLSCTDRLGVFHAAVDPTNEAAAAAYTDTTPPTFTIQYFSDASLTTALPAGNPILKPGTWYLGITAGEPLSAPPLVSIDGDKSLNDLAATPATLVTGTTYRIARTVVDDGNVGGIPDDVSVIGIDLAGNQNADPNPVNEAARTATLDTVPPTFSIRYYSDAALTVPLAGNPRLAPGTFYLKVTASEPLGAAPTVSIAAEGAANNLTNASAALVSGAVYKLARTIATDAAAVGATLENVSVTGADTAGNAATGVDPTDEAARAAFTDTTPPTVSMQYFDDIGLTSGLVGDLYLRLTTKYVLFVANEPLAASPTVTIDAEGAANDLAGAATTLHVGNGYRLTRTVVAEPAAVGAVRESVTVTMQDVAGNTVTVAPTDAATKAAFTDQQAPTITAMQYCANADGTGPFANDAKRPRLKPGTYYIKFTASEPLNVFASNVDITQTEGGDNDVTDGTLALLSGNDYLYTRTIGPGGNAVGATRENLDLDLVDLAGNATVNANPPDESTKAAFIDSVAPTFTIQYYTGNDYAQAFVGNPKLGVGTFGLQVAASEELASAPTFSITSQWTLNDVAPGATPALFSGNIYRIDRGIVLDASADGTRLEDFKVSGTDLAGNAVTDVDPTNEAAKAAYIDMGGPSLVSWTMDLSPDGDAKKIVIVFDEPVAADDVDPSMLYVADSAYSTPFDLGAATVTQEASNALGFTALGGGFVYNLGTFAALDAAVAADFRIQADAGAFLDGAGNGNAALAVGPAPAAFTPDTTPPAIVALHSLDLDPDDGSPTDALEVAFSDYVSDSSINVADFAMKSSPVGSPDYGSGFATAVSSVAPSTPEGNDRFVRILYTPSFILTTGPMYVTLAAWTVTDLAGNMIQPGALPAVLDKASPFATWRMDMNLAGDLKFVELTFSEAMPVAGVDFAKLHVQDDASATPAVTFPLTFGTRTQSLPGTILIDQLGPAGVLQFQGVALGIGQNTTADYFLAADAGAFADAAGNPCLVITPVNPTSFIADGTPLMDVASHSLDINSDGICDALEIRFNDYVRDSTIVPAQFTLAESSDDGKQPFDGFSTAVTSVAAANVANDNAFRLTISVPVADPAYGPSSTFPQEWEYAGALTDLAGNALAPSTTPPIAATDKAKPVPVAWTMDMNPDGALKNLVVTFSEDLLFTQTAVTGKFYVSNPGGTLKRALAGATSNCLGTDATITGLGGANVAAIDAIADIGTSNATAFKLTLTAGAVVDVAGNASIAAAVPIPCTTFTPDTTGPVVQGITYVNSTQSIYRYSDYMDFGTIGSVPFIYFEDATSDGVFATAGMPEHDPIGAGTLLPFTLSAPGARHRDSIRPQSPANAYDLGGRAFTGTGKMYYSNPGLWAPGQPAL